jgi:DNA-binding transcriptional ArsR family regulator
MTTAPPGNPRMPTRSRSRQPYHPDLSDIALVTVLHALSDPVRLEIVHALALAAERPCGDLHGVGGVTPATLSHHLRVLREAGITHTRLHGKHRFLSLRLDDLEGRFPGMLTAILKVGQSSAATDAAQPGSHGREEA